jgi:hypothetical protein
MRVLSNADCLDLWEHGSRLQPLDRGLLVLRAAFPETPSEAVAEWPLGRVNSALAELQCACFGRNLQGQISCPECAEKLEFQMDAQALLTNERESVSSITVGLHSFRLPTTGDLARASREPDTRSAAIQIVESCRMDSGDAAEWREEDLEEIGEKLSAADPLAEIRLTFHCAKCGCQWQEDLDIAAFVWTEIATRSKRLLMEVHTLAVAYGWSEADILSLSEPRRAAYLEMVGI